MNAIAIIPARGGSKGIPRKNILPIAGKPLIAWTIEAAKKSQRIDSVIVSTDDAEIAKVAKEFGAEVVWRPSEISGDFASSETAILHAIQAKFADGSKLPEFTVFLQCTSPLTESIDIDGTIEAVMAKGADTGLAVAHFHYFVWHLDAHGRFCGVNHDKAIRKMRQEREPQYIETGAVYVMKTIGFLHHKHRFFGNTVHYIVPAERVLEIDEPTDFRVAQVLLEERQALRKKQAFPKRVSLIVFDFDGIFTDDSVSVSENGTESVTCSRADGLGIELARKAGIQMLILSKEKNAVVKRRAEKLQLDVLHGVDNKEKVLDEYLASHGLRWSDLIYVGNDINDIECLARAGCGVTVANANASVKAVSNVILSRNGGDHAVRELIDLILK